MGIRALALVAAISFGCQDSAPATSTYSAAATSCMTNADCNDQNACTLDFCTFMGVCVNMMIPGCCTMDSQCDDNDSCTADSCDRQNDTCIHTVIPNCGCTGGNCCTTDADCADGNACTFDTCAGNPPTCQHMPIPDCCQSDADCNDNDNCTSDSCRPLFHRCEHSPISECCHDNRDCRDGSMCTIDTCNTTTDTCSHTAIPNCCTSDMQCFDRNACTTDTCDTSTGTCSNTPVANCCNTDGDCSDGDACTIDRCDQRNNTCVHFPDPMCCTNDNQCRDMNACTLDQCDLATNSCTHQPITDCCLSNMDCTFSSRCEFQTCDQGSHMCVDHDIPNCCRFQGDCDDNDACTTDTCDVSTGTCTNTPIASCCLAGGDCDDHDACTVDSCNTSNHMCTHMPVASCCDSAGACNDNNICTTDTCDESMHACAHAPVANCCDSDAMCDDNNTCTTDSCDVGSHRCKHADHCAPDAGSGAANGLDLSGGGCACDARARSPGGAGGALVLAIAVAWWLARRRRRVVVSGLGLGLALLAAAPAARAGGFDAQLYVPATSSSGYLSQQGGAVLPDGELDIGAVFDFAHDPLVARDPATGNELMHGGIVADRLDMHLVAGYGLTRWLEVGAAVPFVLAQSGDISLVDAMRQLSTTTLGDIRVFGKAALWHRGDVLVSGALDVSFPSGDGTSFTGAPTVAAWPRVVLGWNPGVFTAALNAGFRFQGETQVADATVGDEVTVGAAASYTLRPARAWLIGEAYLAVQTAGGAHDVPAEALVGARAVVTGPWHAQVAIGEGLGRGVTAPAFEAIASVAYASKLELGRKAVADRDRDGIPDDLDQCPDDPEDKDGFQDADGCPDPDNDGDGIPDELDPCPLDPEDHDGYQDHDGCPDPDNDADGIPDAQDQCPNEPEDRDGYQDADGCPDPDNDLDGIPDTKDQCPAAPETKNGFEDEDGCPDELPAQVKQFVGVIKGVNFVAGSAELVPTSTKVLDTAIATLKQFPTLRIEIAGHTDDVPVRPHGKFASNEELSQARAESVRSYMAAMGIPPARLEAKGYGATKPLVNPTGLAGGSLAVARAKNRRVELALLP